MQQTDWHTAYVRLAESGELKHRAKALYSFFRSCQLCPRRCRINRLEGETGVCGAASHVKVASAHPHFGEETSLVGRHGSGTIFFSHCNLLCAYCQNWQISNGGDGALISDEGLGRIMLLFQNLGCHRIHATAGCAACNPLQNKHEKGRAANYCISEPVNLYLLRAALKSCGQALTPYSQETLWAG
ncbi:MAG: hypothetical protein WCB12_15775 [Bryobacteraceae bacterium]